MEKGTLMKDIILKTLKVTFYIALIIIIPFCFPILTRFFIHIQLYSDINTFKEYMEVFFNKYFFIIFLIAIAVVYAMFGNKEKIEEWFSNRDFSFKHKDTEVSTKMAEMVEESNKKKNFNSKMNTKEEDNKIVAISVQEDLNIKKIKKKDESKDKYKKDYEIIKIENEKLRFFSAYNIINQKTKELLNIAYCNKSIDLNEFKRTLINDYKNRNKKNKNLSNAQKNEYANNKYETIKDGLQFLNIIEISDDNKVITLTQYGKTFVEKYIEKEVGGR